MPLLYGRSIRRQLTRMLMATSAVSLLLASTAFVVLGVAYVQQATVPDLQTMAEVLAGSVSAPLAFDDTEEASNVLQTVRARRSIVYAAVYLPDGHRFASYGPLNRIPPTLSATGSRSSVHLNGRYLQLAHPVRMEGDVLGTILLQEDLQSRNRLLLLFGGIVIAVLIVSAMVTFGVACRLQATISRPVMEMAGAMQEVGEHPDDLVRITNRVEGEIGYLIDRFNGMVQQLREHEDQIAAYHARLEESQRAALAANEAKSDFLARMSHELRTPLNAIIGYAEMLQEESEESGPESFVPDLQRIRAAGQHLLMLINDVLDLSKIEARKMELFPEAFEVSALVADIMSTVDPLVKRKSNALVLDCPRDPGGMHSDLTRVRQSLFNLLSNAAKFTEEGTITLAVRRLTEEGTENEGTPVGDRGDWLEFCVRDTGIGITPEQQARIFDAFSQAEASTTRQYGGTGLGLAITKQICEMMGGTIVVESRPGSGSAFTIRLPAQMPERSGTSGPFPGSAISPRDAGLPGPWNVPEVAIDATEET